MVFSQGWRHFKINKAQVPHPGRPWQMRVIHSLAQLLRDPSQAGKAVPGSSPSDADEMHSGRKSRREGDSCGEFQTVLLELPSLPGSLTFSEAGAFKATSKPKWTQIWTSPHHPTVSGSLVPEAPQWPYYLGGPPWVAVQGQGTQEWCGMRGKLPVLNPAPSPHYKEPYDTLWAHCIPPIRWIYHYSSVTLLHDITNRVNPQIFILY